MFNTEKIRMLKVECNINLGELENYFKADEKERPSIGLRIGNSINLQVNDNLKAAIATMTTDVESSPFPISKGKFVLCGEYSIHNAAGLKQDDIYEAFEHEKMKDLVEEMIKKINEIGETMACPFFALSEEVGMPFPK